MAPREIQRILCLPSLLCELCSLRPFALKNRPTAFQPLIRTSCLVLAVALAGCGSGSKTSPVAGVVLLDGKPLVGASIQFVPQGTGRDATGETDKSGEFAMSTFKPRDGVLPGTYKVVIAPPTGTADPTPYASAEDAMATASKAPAKKPAGPAFPAQYSRPDQTPLTQEVPVLGKLKFDLKSS